MAERPDRYYRAGHWVRRSSGGRRPGPKPLTGAGALGVIIVIVVLMVISRGGSGASTVQSPDASVSSAPASP